MIVNMVEKIGIVSHVLAHAFRAHISCHSIPSRLFSEEKRIANLLPFKSFMMKRNIKILVWVQMGGEDY